MIILFISIRFSFLFFLSCVRYVYRYIYFIVTEKLNQQKQCISMFMFICRLSLLLLLLLFFVLSPSIKENKQTNKKIKI